MNILDQLEDFPVGASPPSQVAEVGSPSGAQPSLGGGDTTFPVPDHLQQPVKLPGISERPSVAPAVSTRDISLNLVRPGCDPDNDKRELATHGGEQLLPVPVLAEPETSAVTIGEARESTIEQERHAPISVGQGGQSDSRGGQNTLCHQKNKSNATTQPLSDGESEIQNVASKSIEGIPASAKDGSKNTRHSAAALSAESDIPPASTSTIQGTSSEWLAECEPTLSPESKQKLQGASSSVQTATESTIGEILDQTVAFLRKYVAFPMPEQFDLVALWICHTHVYDIFHWTPYLIVRSPEPECGKSTVLAIIKLLARRAWKVVVPTPAVIYRKIEAHRPTILLDEYDTIYSEKIKSEANETLRGTLNAGFERGDVIPRCDGPKNELLEFSPYCPKALAGIGRLPETVESRAFIIPIVRLGHSEHVQEYDEETAPEEARPIAQALQAWGLLSRAALKAANPSRPQELKPRQRNISKPLLAIADMAGEEWGDRARHALVRICAKEKFISQAGQLLADIRSILLAGSFDKITTDMLLEYLVRVENANSPWPVLWENDLKNGKTRGPAKKLASMLAAFDIHPRSLRFGADVRNGYVRADFGEAWDRYLEPATAETAELDLEL